MEKKTIKRTKKAIKEITGAEFWLGKKVFIRTVTFHYTGFVLAIGTMFLRLSTAAWIADDGRFSESMGDTLKFSEVEMYPANRTPSIGLGAILDIVEIDTLPEKTK
jgi:hypothetical protein